MVLVVIPFYYFFVLALGNLFLRNKIKDACLLFLGSFIVGTSIITGILHLFSYFKLLAPLNVAIFFSLMVIPVIFSLRKFFNDLKRLREVMLQRIATGFQPKVLLGFVIVVLCIYLIDAWTPPRNADAMRYHLPQLKDIYSNKGFIFYPYVHYNFPINFTYFIFPVYLLCGEIGVKLSVVFQLFFVFVIFLKTCCFYNIKNFLFVILLFLLTPLVLKQSTIVATDLFTIIFIYAGFLLLVESKASAIDINFLVGSLAIGYAWGAKGYSMFFSLWFVYLLWKTSRNNIVSFARRSGIFFAIVFVCTSLYYLRNYLNTSNPLWPGMVKLFPDDSVLLNDLANRFTTSVSGTRAISTYLESLKVFFKYPECLFFIWFMGVYGLWIRKKNYIGEGIGSVLFLCLWGFLMPAMYPRLYIYILLPYIYLAVMAAEKLFSKKNKWKYAPAAFLGVYLFYGLAITGWYSYDFIKYQITRDLQSYHRATWYYNEYQWMNKNLPVDAKLMLIVSCGQTFYLDREYVRADPTLTAYLDWEKYQTVDEFYDFFRVNAIEYLFFDMGEVLSNAWTRNSIQNIEKDSRFKILWERTVNNYDSRILRHFTSTKVCLVQVLHPEFEL
ncbi:MAG: hypothetical protein MRJ65_10895 [Candidatus Brocadiaceae bacterium]|nr:hypothetical protein [Candidatus Brocadiaceae bacterium]